MHPPQGHFWKLLHRKNRKVAHKSWSNWWLNLYLTTTHHYHDGPLRVWGNEHLSRLWPGFEQSYGLFPTRTDECNSNIFQQFFFVSRKKRQCAFDFHPIARVWPRSAPCLCRPNAIRRCSERGGPLGNAGRYWVLRCGSKWIRLLVSTVAYFILFPDLSVYFILIFILTFEIGYNSHCAVQIQQVSIACLSRRDAERCAGCLQSAPCPCTMLDAGVPKSP